ncbi:DivIVA domain-containing protein [Actinoplanes missouriensis]|uniref:DivIVA domain-containing protein n=1 Tax=Actinoplanes missouriensis TaxID=1866 RepID=UPI00031008A5|nr:DivIVA domain-containing protein [Actinoplanes missouriensis]
MTSTFTVVLRGYDRDRVDQLLGEVEAAVASADPVKRESARRRLLDPDLVVVLRGYARDEVDAALKEAAQRLSDA